VGPGLGAGPIYPVGLTASGDLSLGEGAERDGVAYWKILWLGAPNDGGRVLVRGLRLDAAGVVLFGAQDSYGLAELRLPAEGWATSEDVDPLWRMWPSYTGAEAAGCYGYQVDGSDFTLHLVFEVIP
jgi:hypothetical protein